MACINLNLNSCLSGLRASLRLCKQKSAIKKLVREMTRLRAKRDNIKNQIYQAEHEGKIPTNEVNQWLREVEELEGQVTDIYQAFQRTSCFSCYYCYSSINRRAAEKLGQANELMSGAGALDPIATVWLPEPTVMLRPPVGIELYVEDIVDYIDSGEVNIIGIYGMGGVGKTTMLKSIQQHYLLKHTRFDCRIWVVASKDCQLKRLQMDIAKSLGLLTLHENDDEQTCGNKLFSYLKNRNCLLLLDDIWEHVDLQLLGMAHSTTERGQQQQQQPHKVVVFTTRSETVCAQMKAEKKIKVKCLDPVQAWQLFEENIDRDVLNSDAGIKFIAEELVKECAGLPLALITIARAMSGKKSWEAWNEALRQLRDQHEWTTIGLSENFYLSENLKNFYLSENFKLSESLLLWYKAFKPSYAELTNDSIRLKYKDFKMKYDSLENDSIRECLLCCALWPEDYDIHKFDELIPCWIGCGIISEFNAINEAFHKGCDYLKALISASLLKDSRRENYYKVEHVKMPNLVRDMALLMLMLFGLVGNKRKWIIEAGMELSDLPSQKEWQDVERASFMRNQISSLQEYGASTFPKLSMLIIRENEFLKTIPQSLFASMPRLTYLDLSGCSITELPKEICSLIELQYLNLSSTDITSLPDEFGCLKKLEYLLLRNTRINTVPIEIISNLSMLKWLDIGGHFPVCDLWLNELKCFKGPHQISLGITINPANFEILGMLSNVSIWDLTVTGLGSSKFPIYDLGTLQWSPRISDNLECLTILDVLGVGMDWEPSFSCLKTLYFRRLGKLENIWLNGVGGFNNLRDLYISDCYMLKDVSWVLQLPCLDFLRISNCWEMEELISNDRRNSNARFGIKMLILFQMKNLHRISLQLLQFPNLEYINVCHCLRLKKLPEIRSSKLKEIRGDQIWWNNLEWDDNSSKDSLTPYFRNHFN